MGLLVTSNILHVFTGLGFFAALTAALAAINLAMCYPDLRPDTKAMTGLLFGFAAATFLVTGAPLMAWVEGLIEMVGIIGFIIVCRFLALPLRISRYDRFLREIFLARKPNPSTLYRLSMLATYALGTFVIFGSLPIIYNILDGICEWGKKSKQLIGTAMTRGYASLLLWAPASVMVVTSLKVTGATWFGIAPVGFGVSLAMLALGLVMRPFRDRGSFQDAPLVSLRAEGCSSGHRDRTGGSQWGDSRGGSSEGGDGRTGDNGVGGSSISLCIAFAALVVIFVAFQSFTTMGPIYTMTVIAIPFSVAWIAITSGIKELRRVFIPSLADSLGASSAQSALLISVGLATRALDETGLSTWLSRTVSYLMPRLGMVGVIFCIAAAILFLGMMGIYPLFSIVAIGKGLAAARGGLAMAAPGAALSVIPAETLALSLILGGSVSYIVCPITATTLVISSFFDVSPLEAGIRWNTAYAWAYVSLGAVFIYVLGRLL
ncbi:MAG TPA: hypothetical protein GX506_10035 [Firmicutes bacterium]|nr:hypothetical protein [Bacillota bacterium]